MAENDARAEPLEELRDALARPQVGAEILAYLEEVTAEAAREHELVLARSQELAGVRLFP